MSFLENTTKPKSPVAKYVKFKSSTKEWTTWNKEKGEQETVDLSKGFIVLDKTYSITGYDGEDNIYSNEIKSFKTENIVVRAGSKIIADGLYADVKDAAKAEGGKYTINLYVVTLDKPSELLKLQLVKGAATGGWDKKNKVSTGGGFNELVFNEARQYVVIKEYKEEVFKANNTKYYIPVFGSEEIDSDASYVAHATETAHELKAYFNEKKEYAKQFVEEKLESLGEYEPKGEFDTKEEIDPNNLPF